MYACSTAAGPANVTTEKPDEFGWWDWTVFLLHTAAEIEHVLMVQYLYAAYSLADGDFSGPNVPADAKTRTDNWRAIITQIAREEMAHLLTGRTCLRFIGARSTSSVRTSRSGVRSIRSRSASQPLTRDSLAKYVAAEMPAATGGAGSHRGSRQPGDGRDRRDAASTASARLFDALAEIFADPTKLLDADLHPDRGRRRCAGAAEDWFAFGPT